jgi:DNA replication and repair protein RecF
MFLQSLYLHNFRSYEEELFEFSPHLNLIYGANAQGKTNLLESIYYLISARSFRTHHASDLIRNGTPHFYLEAHFIKHGIDQALKISYSPQEKRIIYNNTSYSSGSELLGLLQGVVITPDDNALLKGAPLLRRTFIDIQIAQTNPLYTHHLHRYNRSMKQRNHLLKAKNSLTIESWEHEMASSAAYITIERAKVIKDLECKAQELYSLLMKSDDSFQLEYKSGCPATENLGQARDYHLEQFRKMRFREMELGNTLTGPHRDDLLLFINKKDCHFFASEGQQRSCIAALRFAEWQRLKEEAAEPPLMLIDDLGISLDRTRRESLFEHIHALDQVFITSTEREHSFGSKPCKHIKIGAS